MYFDATKNKIGKVPDQKGMFNMSAGAWGIVTMLLWIIGFPAYLVKRKSLLEIAKEKPIEAKGRIAKLIVFMIAGGLWVLASLSAVSLSSLPSCDSTEASSIIGQIISEIPAVKNAGVEYVTVKDTVEQGFNKQTQIRSCSGTLVTTAGEDDLQYFIKWQDQSKGEFWVEIQ